MTAEGQIIPEDIMAIAAELANATIRNYERNERANVARDAIAKAILAERERNAQPRKKIIEAMCELPHSIDDEKVEFRFSSRRPGHNALNQLLTQLEAQFGAKGGA
ncbi:hypothetical protein HFO41_24870 [Rhizobium leguminosarum]|uniref:hypothetical protein n=1 Tax=Rhizobium leguminosarum TaxID=384 RepID=UPI001C9526DB|nr:hypothetical protein [Rhizobium leguminosarum]MBY5692018.1 hypothetical protein [Rhizobium leguminosarum]